MIWMVHRVALDDPTLTELDFQLYQMPMGTKEPRIAPKLMEVLASNTHLSVLNLIDSNVRSGDQAKALAASLAQNSTLRVLNIAMNFLEPADLQDIFNAIVENTALEELYCTNQFCDQAGWNEYQALAEALKQNRTLRKLGMELSTAHWRDQILRGLIRNTEARRKRRWEAAQRLRQEANVTQNSFMDQCAKASFAGELVRDSRVAGGGA